MITDSEKDDIVNNLLKNYEMQKYGMELELLVEQSLPIEDQSSTYNLSSGIELISQKIQALESIMNSTTNN